ncbi:MAG: putative Glycoside hydrolase 15-related protein [Candidatus Saccharibacteria bacterium]|nr:putative Glycoside hydrolase 15-related protein [Candidatus Saccharibacteria bacterium]
MARPIVLGNGELHVGLNKYGLVHDFYYPYVGFENHAAGAKLRHKVGVFVDGVMSWLDDENNWVLSFRYPHTSLVGHTLAKNEDLGIILEFDDAVDAEISLFMRNIHVVNLDERPREIKLFMHQAFAIGDGKSNTDTAQWLPDSNAILHYRGRRAFVISGTHNDTPFDQHTIGLFGVDNLEGSYKDAEDGVLQNNAVEYGRVDSVLGFTLQVAAQSSERVHYWIACGMSAREALYIHKTALQDGIGKRLHTTASWWYEWLKPAIELAKRVPVPHQDLFLHSVMIIKSQMDKRGAVIASTDSTLLNYSKDNYAYSWPRDGAYTMWPMIRMGYFDEPYRFFEFCKRGLHPGGFLMHKYRADGALGSSWHPYYHKDEGVVAPPIQEDETALVVFMFCQFVLMNKDKNLIKDFYVSMLKPMADFLAEYIDEKTGLPKPSYDLWEENFMTTTYTTSVVYGALIAASELAVEAGDEASAVKWRSAGNDIQEAAHKYLFNVDRQVFYKGYRTKAGDIVMDDVLDTSSVFGVFMFGLFDLDGPEMKAAVKTTKERFQVLDDEPGLARYENDVYRRPDATVTGNWWIINTLWLAQYELEQDNMKDVEIIIDWVKNHALHTGMLSEQVNPVNDDSVSPAPLTWSHAEYLSTMLDVIGKKAQ